MEDLEAQLADTINHMINHEFDRLVHLLYTIDIPEDKLRSVMSATAGRDAPQRIAEMIIDRQMKKIEARKMYSANKKTSNRQDSDEEIL